MECRGPESLESQQLLHPEGLVPPELNDGESYNVFVSYSSTDLQWTHDLIQQLEDRGLKVCYHERDFTPGRSILENMSECIAQSQKVLLVLSQDFVKSRWCLLEANMSLFRDCLQRKPIVPVLLQRDLSIPLPLAHLTYLELSHPDFSGQLLRVLCTANHQLNISTVMMPHQAPNIYNGKVFQPLLSLKDVHCLNFGVWSTEVPQPLRRIIQNQQLYREAIEIINRVQREKVRYKSFSSILMPWICLTIFFIFDLILIIYVFNLLSISVEMHIIGILIGVIVVLTWLLVKRIRFFIMEFRRVYVEQCRAIGEANALLCQENILIGDLDGSKLLLAYVLLGACRRKLARWFPNQDIFDDALLELSSDYVVALSKMHFPFKVTDPGHMEGGVCFCQYVRHVLK